MYMHLLIVEEITVEVRHEVLNHIIMSYPSVSNRES
jgi:hypothetical protein